MKVLFVFCITLCCIFAVLAAIFFYQNRLQLSAQNTLNMIIFMISAILSHKTIKLREKNKELMQELDTFLSEHK